MKIRGALVVITETLRLDEGDSITDSYILAMSGPPRWCRRSRLQWLAPRMTRAMVVLHAWQWSKGKENKWMGNFAVELPSDPHPRVRNAVYN